MLELDLATVLWQIFNFSVLAVLLYYLLFRPTLASMRERAAEKARLMDELEEEREEVARMRADLESRLARAEEEASAIVNEAKSQADVERVALLEEAQVEVERILTEAQADAYRLKRQAIDEFHDEILEATVEVSGRIIGQVAPPELHDAMVQQLLDSVWELGRSEMQRVEELRRGLGERAATVVARTAQPLSPEQQGGLVRTLSALADRNINLDLKVDPSLGLGLRVRIGDLIMENSIAGKLADLQESVAEALRAQVSKEPLVDESG